MVCIGGHTTSASGCAVTLDRSPTKAITKGKLRALVANRSAALVQARPWLLEVPYDIRDGAIIEFVKNLKTGRRATSRVCVPARVCA